MWVPRQSPISSLHLQIRSAAIEASRPTWTFCSGTASIAYANTGPVGCAVPTSKIYGQGIDMTGPMAVEVILYNSILMS